MMRTPPTFEAVASALAFIDANALTHDERVKLAFAVFDGVGDQGGDLWLDWAGGRTDPDRPGDRATWRSARKRGAVTVATLFAMARDRGWRPAPTDPTPTPTAEELRARAAAQREAEEREARDTAERHRHGAAEAAALWARGSDEGASPYLTRKMVGRHGGRFLPDGAFLVPATDAAGDLVNVQTIKPERPADGGPEKLFIKGARKAGTWHMLGEPEAAPWLLLAEGYATAASVHEATGRPVAVAWDSGNLPKVARALRGMYPAARLAVCGDDDAPTAARTGKNPGRIKATEAASLAKGPAIFPSADALPPGGTDFNDLHTAAGLDAVRQVIEAALQAAENAAPVPTPARPKKAAPATRQRPARGRGDDAPDDEAGASRRDRFRCDEAGLWFDPPADEGGGKAAAVRVCDPLRVTARARDAHDTGAALLLEFDAFGKPRQWLMPRHMLSGDGAAYRFRLQDQGFVTPTDAKRRALLTAYLNTRTPSALVRTVDSVGWHRGAFVLPAETLGDDDADRLMFQSEARTEANFGQRGTVAQWQERIGRLCVGNSRLTFAASMAFAGPLLPWCGGMDGGGVHLWGDSSSGKTTALRVAVSVWGGPRYLQRWRGTDNGIEGLCTQHNHCLLILDELAQLDPRAAGEAAYMIANGGEKARGRQTGSGTRPIKTWLLIFLSSGEIGLAEHMSEGGRRTRAGQELRMVDLPADAGAGLGIFQTLHEHSSGDALAKHLTRAAETTYGTAGRAWLEHLTANTGDLARTLRDRMERAEGVIVPELASGQVKRVGRRFALVAAAGEMATDAGLTGWPRGTATAAAHRCFNDWIESRPGGIGLSEDAQMLRQLRQWFGLHGDSRFKPWHRTDTDNKPNTPFMAGWRKEIMGDVRNEAGDLVNVPIAREWFTLTDVFRTEAAKGFNERAALRLLRERGHLHTEGKRPGFGCTASPPGAEKCMVYRVRSSLLGDVEE